MAPLQKMQIFRFCFFCHPLSSFSRLGRLGPFPLPGIQWCLLLIGAPSRDGYPVAPVSSRCRGAGSHLLDLGLRPLEARADVVGFDLDHRALLALLVLP